MRKTILCIVLILCILLSCSFAADFGQAFARFADWLRPTADAVLRALGIQPSPSAEAIPAPPEAAPIKTQPPMPSPSPIPSPSPAATPSPSPTPTPAPTPEPEPLLYSRAWLDRYAPASVASFEEQVGDNGDYEEITDYPPPDTYQLVVDYYNQCVYAFSRDEYGGYTVLERVMICTTGGNGNWTPEGVYHLGKDYHRFGYFTSFNCYAQYWTQMAGSFYFHSILYSERDASTYRMSSYDKLGSPASHGCIRLLVPDARWIYENCAPGTQCTVTTDIPEDKALKQALRHGYEGAVDSIGTPGEDDAAPS